jgi:hypothetical protein
MWTRGTLLQDACPECEGEVRDITNTSKGQMFLSIIAAPAELRSSSLKQQNIYATGPSLIFTGGK